DLRDVAAEAAVAVDQCSARAGARGGERGGEAAWAAAHDQDVGFQHDIRRSYCFVDLFHCAGIISFIGTSTQRPARGILIIEAAVIILSRTVGKKCPTVRKHYEGMAACSGPHGYFFG